MPVSRETKEAYYRPVNRRLISLSNEELRALLDIRAKKVHDTLDPKGFWECNQIVYWSAMFAPLLDLYEVMMEIQARYPFDEIGKYVEEGKGGAYFTRMIPIPNAAWATVALNEFKRLNKLYGLSEVPREIFN